MLHQNEGVAKDIGSKKARNQIQDTGERSPQEHGTRDLKISAVQCTVAVVLGGSQSDDSPRTEMLEKCYQEDETGNYCELDTQAKVFGDALVIDICKTKDSLLFQENKKM